MRSSFPFTFPFKTPFFNKLANLNTEIDHFSTWVSEIITFLQFNFTIFVSTSLQSGVDSVVDHFCSQTSHLEQTLISICSDSEKIEAYQTEGEDQGV